MNELSVSLSTISCDLFHLKDILQSIFHSVVFCRSISRDFEPLVDTIFRDNPQRAISYLRVPEASLQLRIDDDVETQITEVGQKFKENPGQPLGVTFSIVFGIVKTRIFRSSLVHPFETWAVNIMIDDLRYEGEEALDRLSNESRALLMEISKRLPLKNFPMRKNDESLCPYSIRIYHTHQTRTAEKDVLFRM
ncbi:hypothetical protein PCE1_002463 [Barthelona sp. PCE]